MAWGLRVVLLIELAFYLLPRTKSVSVSEQEAGVVVMRVIQSLYRSLLLDIIFLIAIFLV